MTTSSDITQTLTTEYARLATGFGDVLDEIPSDLWAAPSPCEGWTARDVVGHVIETQRDFIARHEIDLGEAPDLDDPAAAWRAHRTAVADRLADPAVGAMPFDGHFGPTTVGETLLRFYGFDMVAHRWDVASATGRELRFTDAELEMMETAAAGFGPALYGDGVCRSGVEAPAGADRQARVLAILGRSA